MEKYPIPYEEAAICCTCAIIGALKETPSEHVPLHTYFIFKGLDTFEFNVNTFIRSDGKLESQHTIVPPSWFRPEVIAMTNATLMENIRCCILSQYGRTW